MQHFASCTTRVERVSSIALDCTRGHEMLGILHYPSQMGEFDCLRLISRQCSAWHPVPLESNGWVRLPSRPWNAWHPVLPELNGWVRLPSIDMQHLASCSIQVEFDCLRLISRPCSAWHPAPPESNRCILCYPRQTGEFDCHEALGILRYPCQTGEFDCLRLHPRPSSTWYPVLQQSNDWVRLPWLHPRPWSAWHSVLPKTNGWVRLPSIAPKLSQVPWSACHTVLIESNRWVQLPLIAPKAMKHL